MIEDLEVGIQETEVLEIQEVLVIETADAEILIQTEEDIKKYLKCS